MEWVKTNNSDYKQLSHFKPNTQTFDVPSSCHTENFRNVYFLDLEEEPFEKPFVSETVCWDQETMVSQLSWKKRHCTYLRHDGCDWWYMDIYVYTYATIIYIRKRNRFNIRDTIYSIIWYYCSRLDIYIYTVKFSLSLFHILLSVHSHNGQFWMPDNIFYSLWSLRFIKFSVMIPRSWL